MRAAVEHIAYGSENDDEFFGTMSHMLCNGHSASLKSLTAAAKT